MAAKKRTEAQVAQDREFITRLYLQGASHSVISSRLTSDLKRNYTLTRQQIAYDIDAIKAIIFKDFKESILTTFVEQLRKIDALEWEAWEAWEKSKLPETETVSEPAAEDEKARRRGGSKSTALTATKITERTRPGNPAYWDRAMECVRMRLEIIGAMRTRGLDPGEFFKGSDMAGGSAPGSPVQFYLPHNGRDKKQIIKLPVKTKAK